MTTRWLTGSILLCVFVAAISMASARYVGTESGVKHPISAPTAAEIGKSFITPEPGWIAGEVGYGGPADGNWTNALTNQSTWRDYRLSATMNLAKPADRQDGMEIGCFAVFNSLANLGGYEAGMILRYQSPQKFYRLAVSTLWKELILWRPSGGVVQAVPYPFEVGKSYALAVECRGKQIRVQVDGKLLIDWWDTADSLDMGKTGLARKEGEAYFSAVKLEPLLRSQAVPPAHVARFREQQWHNYRFFFDGNEPVFMLTERNILDLMKFRPGYRPILYTFNFITDWSRFYTTKVTKSAVVKDGAQLILDVTAMDPNTKSAITCEAHLVVTYDAATNLYSYDHTCTTRIPTQEEADKVSADWDHGDAVFLGGVGGAITRDPKNPKPLYQWSVFEAPDGHLYKVPMNHNGHYDGTAQRNGGPFKAGGFGMVIVGDPVLSPIVRVPERTASFEDNHIGHCWWAYDIHTLFTVKKTDGKVQPGDYVTRVQYLGMNAAEAQPLLAKADFYKSRNLDLRFPVFTGGLGFTEPFDKTVTWATPHTEHRIFSGVVDSQVGRGDKSSLRLDGPTEAWTLTGGSYFTGGYTKKIRVSGWVKTKDVTGDGPAVGFHRKDNNKFEYHLIGLTGANDWTKFSYVTGFPADCWGVDLYWRNSGTGTVWFDDFKIETVDDKTEATAKNYPVKPVDPDIVLQWDGKGDAGGVLDSSGYGSHGKFYGVTRVETDGRRALALDGKSYIWPLPSEHMTLGPDTTMIFDLKPEAGGYLVWWGFAFQFSINGAAPKYALYYWSAGKGIQSKPILDAGVWQTLAIVVTQGKISYYVNGKLVDAVEANTLDGNPANHAQSTWHRHLSFFGAGSGDYGLVPEGPNNCLKGQARGVTVYKRALTAEEIGKL
ncbi:MAG: LamG-like jellyroll fold domain-containing protein [Armatimonadota bacterium]